MGDYRTRFDTLSRKRLCVNVAQMHRFPIISVALVTMMVACSGSGEGDQTRAGWLNVLSHKKAASAPGARPEAKQAYADTLAAFTRKHPQHSRARAVYERVQLDFARELSALGRHRDALAFYRAVLARDPANEEAARGLREAADRLAVSRQKLQLLEVGMSQREVAGILGNPMPGWSAQTHRREASTEAWYYRTTLGTVAGVYFRDGKLLAAEESSDAQVAVLTR
jgi:hypothetical protein